MKNLYSVINIDWCIKFIRCILKLLPLQGALLIAIIPRALPWAKSFCPFRACCCGLLDLLGVAAYMSFLVFWALLLWLLIIQYAFLYYWNYPAHPPVLLKLPSTPSCTIEITQHTLLYGWYYPARPPVLLKLPNTPSCTIEITQHALLYGWNYPARPSVLLNLSCTPWKGRSS